MSQNLDELRDYKNSDLADPINQNSTNICISVYEVNHLIKQWKGWYGTKETNSDPSMSVYKDKIYLLYSSTNINMDIIDLRTGVTLSSKTYTGATQAIDIVANHLGVYMLANIDDGFKDNDSSDSYSTQNSNTNFAIILADHDGNIIEIESYDTTDAVNDLGAEYPKKLVVGIQNKQQPLYAFISSRGNDQNQRGGIYITQPTDQQALFKTGDTLVSCSSVTANCELCHSEGWFRWTDGYKIQDGECKLTCSDYFYHQYDDIDDSLDIDICVPCHQTCKTCSGPSEYECLTWDADKVPDLSKGTWTWNPSNLEKYLGLGGIWVSNWGHELTGIKQNKCVRGCSEDSDDYSQKANLLKALPKSTKTNCESLTKHFSFTENVTIYTPLSPENLMQESFTTTFWIKVKSTSYPSFIILSYGKLSC